jgi:murein L,D-transpeptidase YcbB/YkuD
MKFVIFHPTWGVPSGIKNNELAPHLRRASPVSNDFFSFFDGGGGRSASRVLERFGGLVPTYNGRPVNPDSVDWSRVDINRFSFTQPPGARNVLGVVKFRFPNKHDVYMHDTPERHLFNGASRAFSHGCMRVQNPMRMAEVILDYDRGWSPDRVRSMVDSRSSTTDVTLEKRVQVHIAYFTAIAEDDGKVRYVRDLYGLDSRVASALEGRRVEVAARADQTSKVEPSSSEETPRRSSSRRREAQRRRQPAPPARASNSNPFAGLFQ